jgi:uncharacterized metal-binding protein (TIGR02443 family)
MLKRFISGAVCPKCGTLDTLHMYKKNNDEIRECVECLFVETYKQSQDSMDSQEGIHTRVTPVGKVLYDENEVPLKIIK